MAGNQTEARLYKFLHANIYGAPSDTPCVQIQLRQIGMNDSILHSEEIPEDLSILTEDRLYEMINQILDLASQDADGFGAIQSYYCVAFFKGDRRPSQRSPTFRISPDNVDTAIDGSEPANAHGLLKQLMRHLEAKERTSTLEREAVMRHLTATVERLTTANLAHEQQRIEMFRFTEELMSERHQRQLEEKYAERKDERMAEALQLIKDWGPTIVNRLSGRNVLPGAKSPEKAIIEQVMSKITADELEQIAAVLGPKALPFVDLFLNVQKEKENMQLPGKREIPDEPPPSEEDESDKPIH